MQELCWGFWITGLLYCWCVVAVAGIRILLLIRCDSFRETALQSIPPQMRSGLAPGLLPWAGALLAAIACWAALYAYTWLFSFYGLFLSVFAEMEPRSLLGRNGFINSDFFTPAAYLAQICWPLAAGAIFADRGHLLNESPFRLLLRPFSRHLVKIHVAILTMPFAALLSWAMLRQRHQTATVLFVLAVFYFVPAPDPTLRAALPFSVPGAKKAAANISGR